MVDPCALLWQLCRSAVCHPRTRSKFRAARRRHPQASPRSQLRPAMTPLEEESSARLRTGGGSTWNRRRHRGHRHHLSRTCRRAQRSAALAFSGQSAAQGAFAPQGGPRAHHWGARSAHTCNTLPVQCLRSRCAILLGQYRATPIDLCACASASHALFVLNLAMLRVCPAQVPLPRARYLHSGSPALFASPGPTLGEKAGHVGSLQDTPFSRAYHPCRRDSHVPRARALLTGVCATVMQSLETRRCMRL